MDSLIYIALIRSILTGDWGRLYISHFITALIHLCYSLIYLAEINIGCRFLPVQMPTTSLWDQAS